MFLSLVRPLKRKIITNGRKLVSLISFQRKFHQKQKITETMSDKRTLCNGSKQISDYGHHFEQTEIDAFKALLPGIIEEFTKDEPTDDLYSNVPELNAYRKRMTDYVVSSGGCFRGLTSILSYQSFENKEKLTPENIRLSRILGWVIEINEAYIVLWDDIVDEGKVRRGRPIWPIASKNYVRTLDDGIFLQNVTFALLKINFSHLPCYSNLFDVFLKTLIKTNTGQMIDNMSILEGKIDWNFFKWPNYYTNISSKTGYLVYYFPVAAGMYLANIDDPQLHREAESCLIKVGQFSQIENDYDDVFTYKLTRGYYGQDISIGRMTWLSLTAYDKANSEQKQIMKEHYGKRNEQSDNIIRKLYKELDLPTEFKKFKKESFRRTGKEINQISNSKLKNICMATLESVYRERYY